jgi:hypothetical protein
VANAVVLLMVRRAFDAAVVSLGPLGVPPKSDRLIEIRRRHGDAVTIDWRGRDAPHGDVLPGDAIERDLQQEGAQRRDVADVEDDLKAGDAGAGRDRTEAPSRQP